MSEVGIVIIGRNEGERLEHCIRSFTQPGLQIVYVDSNSTDNSVEFVRSQGFDVVELDMSIPFSAARARNEGYRYLISKYPDIEYIQFIDGDCVVCDGWMTYACEYLKTNPRLAAVCGRRKEKFPARTIYNRFCDIEWDTPIGMAKSTGGDFMCRKQALLDVQGFNPQFIAGEEPEMCFRMRQQGWLIERLDRQMTLHDANMTSISHWWKRNERSGHAYAQGFFVHGNSNERYNRSSIIRILFWSLLLPLFVVLATVIFSSWFLLILIIYPLKILQITLQNRKKLGTKISLLYATSLVFCKFPQFKGIINFYRKQLSGQNFQIIEYKG